jgi:mannose-6-phosphate isomerase-like protein (cupin superfamily)
MSVRRVVTGIDDQGRSRVLSDARQDATEGVPGVLSMTPLWRTTPESLDLPLKSAVAPAGPPLAGLPVGHTLFSIVEIGPGDISKSDRFGDLVASGGMERAMSRGDDRRHPGMHATTTIDYVYVLEGELTLILDEGEVILRAGDVLVQGGASHSWINHTDRPARLLGALVGAGR